jgi:porphobilinogen synthase
MNVKRFRDRRVDEETRSRFRETRLEAGDFIWPLFLVEGRGVKEPIEALPGVHRYSIDVLLPELERLSHMGLRSILLFGVPSHKGVEGAYDPEGVVQKAIPKIKERLGDLEVMTDVCLCSYTEDGHCHVGDNDETCELLARVAVSHARAGADVVAPSDMMDGRVRWIREALDREGLRKKRIVSYAAKYASAFYGPFRHAADCAPKSGDRRGYQMDPANGREALEEIGADLEEGADAVIIKPALAYLDVVANTRAKYDCPVMAYNVSGEYAMLLEAVRKGIVPPAAVVETLLSIKRAGAHRIISYFTPAFLEGRL